jgi:hypothetical protein
MEEPTNIAISRKADGWRWDIFHADESLDAGGTEETLDAAVTSVQNALRRRSKVVQVEVRKKRG